MQLFNYTAIDASGAEKKGQVEAISFAEALTRIKQMDLFPSEVVPADGGKKGRGSLIPALGHIFGARKGSRQTIKPQDLVIFTRQLSVLLDAGLALVRSLHTLEKQVRFEAMSVLIGELAGMIESGKTFSDALAHYPAAFSKVYVNIIKAGETGGALDEVLKNLADYLERNLRLTQRIQAALIYPALVLTVSVGILGFIIAFVIPRFMALFEDSGMSLPLITMFIMHLSKFLLARWYVIAGIIAGLIVGYRVLLYNIAFRFFRDSLVLRLPVFGPLIQKIIASRFSRTLSTLLSGGVPILRALELTKEVSGNEVVSRAVAAVYGSVREGGFISRVLEHSDVFPQLMINMIAVGEESGALDKMLAKVADTYEEEVEITTNALTSLLEPMLVLGVGSIVGVIVLSMFLPLITLIQSLTQ
ncbi:MAG: type II secretion system F family protein [Candidatus Omnitrophica bacterium]|nr:type II secretion system F family protein [Candidatus Omnitrophota bacterium]